MTVDTGGRCTGADGAVGDDPDADALSAAALEAMAGAVQVRASADAVDLQAVATLTTTRRRQALRRDPAADLDLVDTGTAAEISLLLRMSPGTARSRMVLALHLTGAPDDDAPRGHGPATFDALRRGELDLVRARRISDTLTAIPLPEVDESVARDLGVDVPEDGSPAQRREALTAAARLVRARAQALVESEALEPGSVPHLADRRPGPAAGRLTPAQLDARLRRLVARVLPGLHEQRLLEAHDRRSCTFRHLSGPDEGMALLTVTGRADLLQAAYLRLDGTARTLMAADRAAAAAEPEADAGTTRTVQQARADTFVALVLGDSETLAEAHGVSVELSLVAPAGTVLPGAPGGPGGPGGEPGELDGFGPVPASLVRELAADARWRRWATDPDTGLVTWTSPTTYRPTAAVARLVRARDRECTFPTCRARARTEIDHVVRFPDGATVPQNLCVACKRHHRLKHRGSFRTRLGPDGTLTWTTPTGASVRNATPSGPATVAGGGFPPPEPEPPPPF